VADLHGLADLSADDFREARRMSGPMQSPVLNLGAPFALPGTALNGQRKPSLAEAAKGFESIFWTMLLKEMRQSLEPGSLFGKDTGDIYGGLFDQFMAQHLTQGKGMGIAQALIKQLEPKTAHEPPPSRQPPRS
jgi:flagellar protein FlgJ